MVSSVQSVKHRKKDTKELRRWINEQSQWICCHLTLYQEPQLLAPTALETAAANTPPEYFMAFRGTVKSCPVCVTDYQINVCWCDHKGWVVKMKTWQVLGSARSEVDWLWITMIDEYQNSNSTAKRFQDSRYPPGIARHAWSKGDKVIVKPEGTWATRSKHPMAPNSS
jgi:hypothetical protein